MIHAERAKMVLETIKAHKDRFRYDDYVRTKDISWDECTLQEAKDHCGTVACVAGWTLLLCKDPEETLTSACYHVGGQAKELLNLTDLEAQFLFFIASNQANADDATMRLEWLIAGNDWLDYDIRKESWFEKSAENKHRAVHFYPVLSTLLSRAWEKDNKLTEKLEAMGNNDS